MPGGDPRAVRIALAAAVGLVLADSSVVVLALPDIYRELDVSVTAVTWVLIGFNLVLAATAVPAAHAASRVGPARLTAAGLGLFAVASLACGLAPSIGVLIAARCLQAVGGLLTELVSWQSIFLVQVPAAILLAAPIVGAARGEGTSNGVGAAGRPHLAANAALGLISAALAAALFLVVLMLIEGWRLSPIAAAAAVSVLPAFALLSAPLARRVPAVEARAAAGAILIAGGLAALGLLPSASVVLTFPPQALVGVGLALTLSALTEAAMEGRAPQAIHGGWTIASRHAGVVVGLLLLTPVFTADLETERADAEAAGTAALLDARLPPGAKLELADRIAEQIEAEGDKVPMVAPAFEPLPSDPAERVETVALRARIEDEVDAAATHAFSASFLIAAVFALAALIPIAIARRRVQL